MDNKAYAPELDLIEVEQPKKRLEDLKRIINQYEELEKKCDVILEKIRKRKML